MASLAWPTCEFVCCLYLCLLNFTKVTLERKAFFHASPSVTLCYATFQEAYVTLTSILKYIRLQTVRIFYDNFSQTKSQAFSILLELLHARFLSLLLKVSYSTTGKVLMLLVINA